MSIEDDKSDLSFADIKIFTGGLIKRPTGTYRFERPDEFLPPFPSAQKMLLRLYADLADKFGLVAKKHLYDRAYYRFECGSRGVDIFWSEHPDFVDVILLVRVAPGCSQPGRWADEHVHDGTSEYQRIRHQGRRRLWAEGMEQPGVVDAVFQHLQGATR